MPRNRRPKAPEPVDTMPALYANRLDPIGPVGLHETHMHVVTAQTVPEACPTPRWCSTHGPCLSDGSCRYEGEQNWPEPRSMTYGGWLRDG
jgi:hypothetical protein